jgi:hypothetical protein
LRQSQRRQTVEPLTHAQVYTRILALHRSEEILRADLGPFANHDPIEDGLSIELHGRHKNLTERQRQIVQCENGPMGSRNVGESHPLLAGAPVDELTNQISMADVASVFRNHVVVDPS